MPRSRPSKSPGARMTRMASFWAAIAAMSMLLVMTVAVMARAASARANWLVVERTFYYLRHGETDWNREHRAQGHNDIPLNETGVAQAYAAVPALARCGIATVCTSPLARARRTAEIVNETLGRPLVVIDALK